MRGIFGWGPLVSEEFEGDFARVSGGLDAARQQLLGAVERLGEADLDRGTRGGWTVRKVLEHTIQSEWFYAAGVDALRERTPRRPAPGDIDLGSLSAVLASLEKSRQALQDAAEGVDEDAFYAVRTVLHQEYSVLSILENVELHDNEHSAQIGRILSNSAE